MAWTKVKFSHNNFKICPYKSCLLSPGTHFTPLVAFQILNASAPKTQSKFRAHRWPRWENLKVWTNFLAKPGRIPQVDLCKSWSWIHDLQLLVLEFSKFSSTFWSLNRSNTPWPNGWKCRPPERALPRSAPRRRRQLCVKMGTFRGLSR